MAVSINNPSFNEFQLNGSVPTTISVIETDSTSQSGSASGSISTGERQLFRVQVVAGDTIGVTLDTSSGSLDPFLRILDPSSTQVAENDDGGTGSNAALTFTATETGVYFIYAGGLRRQSGVRRERRRCYNPGWKRRWNAQHGPIVGRVI